MDVANVPNFAAHSLFYCAIMRQHQHPPAWQFFTILQIQLLFARLKM